MLTVGSLFAGIGGFDLGLERAGMRIVWQCESDPFCRNVLKRHWPNVPCYENVRTLRGEEVEWVDILCGGFPCQDLSVAGKGQGLSGPDSGLWSNYARLIGELRPQYAIVENVTGLLSRGFGQVLADLAACGYDSEWDCLPAETFGAPHRRDRIWLVAYPSSETERRQGEGFDNEGWREDVEWSGFRLAYAERSGLERRSLAREPQVTQSRDKSWWSFESGVCRMDSRFSSKLDGDITSEPQGESRPDQMVSALRKEVVSQSKSQPWPAGRYGMFQEEEILRSELHGLGISERQSFNHLPQTIQEALLRKLWAYAAVRCSSSGRESSEQFASELAYAMRQVSHQVALEPWENYAKAARSYMFRLREAISSLGFLQYTLDSLSQAWFALSEEDKKWCAMAMVRGQWSNEWPGLRKTTASCPNRVDRLHALGNSLVPQISEWIGRRIVTYEEFVCQSLT